MSGSPSHETKNSSAVKPNWVERPLEPIVSRGGKGMRVLGFVDVSKLSLRPLPALLALPPSNSACSSASRSTSKEAERRWEDTWQDDAWEETTWNEQGDWQLRESWKQSNWSDENDWKEGSWKDDAATWSGDDAWKNEGSKNEARPTERKAETKREDEEEPAGRWHQGYNCQHGSYSSYYGYRRPGGVSGEVDSRLSSIASKLGDDCFRGKEVLDIGCNVGEISLAVAQHFSAARVVGVDIDEGLVKTATWNRDSSGFGPEGSRCSECRLDFRSEDFLTSPLRRPPSNDIERFDAIVCLSVTKWVHFAHGDDGIRKLFRRVWRRLRPGGLFVLEPQEWRSYKKKRYISPEVYQTVAGIKLRPQGFDECLTDLGFEHIDTIAPPAQGPQGFRRSLRLFRRPEAEVEPAETTQEVDPKCKKSKSPACSSNADATADVDSKPKIKRARGEAAAVEALGEEEEPSPKVSKKRSSRKAQKETDAPGAEAVAEDSRAPPIGHDVQPEAAKVSKKQTSRNATRDVDVEEEASEAVRVKKKLFTTVQSESSKTEGPEGGSG